MGLDVPDLDDREYEEMIEAARKRLPAYSEEWTNYNPNDPGIAILEVLAWLTETYTYQVDQVTDEHREKYLQLMGEHPRPPRAASVQLELEPPAGTAGMTVEEGQLLEVVDGSATDKVFRTAREIALVDASIESLVSAGPGRRTDHTHANETEGMFYRPFGTDAEAGSAMYLGFDRDPFGEADTLSMTVDYHDDDLPEPAGHGDEDPTFEPSVAVEWEYCDDYGHWADDGAWSSLSVVEDGTDGLYHGGTVTVARPDDWTPGEWATDEAPVLGRDPGLVWIRCRLVEGGYEIPPQFDGIDLNVVEATHRATVEDERLTRTRSGKRPANLTEQAYEFGRSPVLEAEITVDGEPWHEVQDFDASGPTDHHYVLDNAEGVVHFGDGVRGKMPEPKATVVAERYVYGGGDRGNVPASSNWQFVTPVEEDHPLDDVSVTPKRAASGGADAETLDEAFHRVKRDLDTPYRTVTPEDFEYVATHTPGLRFGRATVLVDEDASSGPPTVTVVVVPYAPLDLARPDPSEGFLDAVERHLDRHRLLTDRVSVERPNYVGVDVDVEVRSAGWFPKAEGEGAIESTVMEYLDAIHGFDGTGWPFGRTLYREELYDLLAGVEWIETVHDVSLDVRGNATVDGDGNVLIDDTSLFYLEDLSATVRTINRNDDRRRG